MQNDHSIMVRADARSMGAVTALDTRVSSRWQASDPTKRTFGNKPFTGTSACVSYKLDADGNKVGAHIFRNTRDARTRKPNRVVDGAHRITAADLAPIGDSNH